MTQSSWHLPDPELQPEFYADIPLKRLLAWIVDTAIVILACLLILPFTAFIGLFFFPVLMLMVGLPYRVMTIANGSATWGMRLMAIELRNAQGERFDLGTALAHTLLFTACCAVLPVQLGSAILMASSPRAQGIPDFLLGTVAINRRASA